MTKLNVGVDRFNNSVTFKLMPGQSGAPGSVPTVKIECDKPFEGNPDFDDAFWSFRMPIIVDMLAGVPGTEWEICLIDGVSAGVR